MQGRKIEDNLKAIHFGVVDKELNLPHRSAERLLEVAAKSLNYVLDRKGASVIKFKEGPRPSSEAPSWSNTRPRPFGR